MLLLKPLIYAFYFLYARSGANDIVNNPWYSKRMFRLLTELGVNASLDIVFSHGNWWEHTRASGDGGVNNDKTMRDFYSMCYETSRLHRKAKLCDIGGSTYLKDDISTEISKKYGKENLVAIDGTVDGTADSKTVTSNSSETLDANNSTEPNSSSIYNKCRNKFTIAVLNNRHGGLCGFRVIQQSIATDRSVVSVNVQLFSRRKIIIEAIKEMRDSPSHLLDRNLFNDLDDIDVINLDVKKLGEWRSRWQDLDSSNSNFNSKNQQDIRRIQSDFNDDKHRINVQMDTQRMSENPEWHGLFQLPPELDHAILCTVRTSNVNRLLLKDLLATSCLIQQEHNHSKRPSVNYPVILIVDGVIIQTSSEAEDGSNILFRNVTDIELCWTKKTKIIPKDTVVEEPQKCLEDWNPLREKNYDAGKSVHSIFLKPLVIIYGTPSDHSLRTILRDFAIYLTNSVSSVYDSSVRVYSDLEYK